MFVLNVECVSCELLLLVFVIVVFWLCLLLVECLCLFVSLFVCCISRVFCVVCASFCSLCSCLLLFVLVVVTCVCCCFFFLFSWRSLRLLCVFLYMLLVFGYHVVRACSCAFVCVGCCRVCVRISCRIRCVLLYDVVGVCCWCRYMCSLSLLLVSLCLLLL